MILRVLELIMLTDICLSLNGFHLDQPVDGIQNAPRMKFIASTTTGIILKELSNQKKDRSENCSFVIAD